jgi:hypothetical protein
MSFRRAAAIGLLALWGIAMHAQAAGNRVTDSDLVKMLKAGVDEQTIQWVIVNSNGKMLDASPAAMQSLKAAGASEKILDAVAAKAQVGHPAVGLTNPITAHTTKMQHGASVGSELLDPTLSAVTARRLESLQGETCEDGLQTVDDCHANHKTGCTQSENPRYDAYLNYLKNGLPDPKSTISTSVNGGSPLGQSVYGSLEGGLPDTLTATNHAQHAVELAHMGEGQVVTVIGTVYYTIAGGSETCNCQLTGDDSVIDFHVGVGFSGFPLGIDVLNQLRSGSDYSKILSLTDQHALDQPSVVVEMTPYYREQFRPGWTFQAVHRAIGRQVKVTGQLMIDNVHFKPADDCGLADADLRTCWRASSWEIHPVTSFQVCKVNQCDVNSADWVDLEKF